jgi:hypothetical protein
MVVAAVIRQRQSTAVTAAAASSSSSISISGTSNSNSSNHHHYHNHSKLSSSYNNNNHNNNNNNSQNHHSTEHGSGVGVGGSSCGLTTGTITISNNTDIGNNGGHQAATTPTRTNTSKARSRSGGSNWKQELIQWFICARSNSGGSSNNANGNVMLRRSPPTSSSSNVNLNLGLKTRRTAGTSASFRKSSHNYHNQYYSLLLRQVCGGVALMTITVVVAVAVVCCLLWLDASSSSPASASLLPHAHPHPQFFHFFDHGDMHHGNYLNLHKPRRLAKSEEHHIPLLLNSLLNPSLQSFHNKKMIGVPKPRGKFKSFISEWEQEEHNNEQDADDAADPITHELHPLRDVPSLGITETRRHVHEPYREGKFYQFALAEQEGGGADVLPPSEKDWATYFSFDDDLVNNNSDPNCKKPAWYYTNNPTCNNVHELEFLRTPEDRFINRGAYREVWSYSLESEQQYHTKQQQPPLKEDDSHTHTPHQLMMKRLKYLHPLTDEYLDDIRKDAMFMQVLHKSPRIVDMYAYCSTTVLVESMELEVEEFVVPGNGWVQGERESEYFEKSQLDAVQPRNEPYLTLQMKLSWALGMAQTLAELHGFEDGIIVHCDVQIAQWLRSWGTPHRIKLSDFNRAEILLFNSQRNKYCPLDNGNGAGNFRSPEEYAPSEFLTEAVDVYSFGNILYGFLTGLWPFYDAASTKIVQKEVKRGSKPYVDRRYRARSFYEYKLVELMEWCWIHDSQERATIFQVVDFLTRLNHEFEMFGPDWYPEGWHDTIDSRSRSRNMSESHSKSKSKSADSQTRSRSEPHS